MASSIPTTVKFFINNFQSFITLKLDSNNYLAWRVQVETAMAANDLSDIIQKGQDTGSANDSGDTEVEADQRKSSTDKLILFCLMATLSSSILTNVVGSRGVRDLWIKIGRAHV